MSMDTKQSFMQAFEATTQPVAGRARRQLGDVEIELLAQTEHADYQMGEQEVYLSDIKASTLHQGHGTRAMEALLSLADQFGMHIVLHACPNDDRPEAPGTGGVIDFYKRFGFYKCGQNNEMTRRPYGEQPPPVTFDF